MSSTFDTVAGIIAETSGLPREQITPESHVIDDLGIDSLDFLDIVFAIDKEFGIKVPVEAWTQEVNAGSAPAGQYFVMGNLAKRIDELVAAKYQADAKQVQFHYDVSDDFYALWLDPRRVYSCAYYRDAGMPLAQALAEQGAAGLTTMLPSVHAVEVAAVVRKVDGRAAREAALGSAPAAPDARVSAEPVAGLVFTLLSPCEPGCSGSQCGECRTASRRFQIVATRFILRNLRGYRARWPRPG